jgi:phage/plasmid-like protein (TIGR03299 family)
MSRETTWARIGTDVGGITTVDDILTKAGLDYTVVKEPMFLRDGVEVTSRIATVKTRPEDGLRPALREPAGVVSERYTICQNREAFQFLEEIPNIEFVRAGETYNGMVYIIGRLPDLKVVDDTFTPYVIFQNSHNGWFSLRATICPLRIVCQNQFNMSFGEMQNTISIRHSSRIADTMAEAQQLLRDTALYMQGFTNTALELAQLKITDADRNRICDAFFNATKAVTERQQEILAEKKAALARCYADDDNSNYRGTAWGLINAATDLETHKARKASENSLDSAFLNVTFDSGEINRLLSIIRQTVGA